MVEGEQRQIQSQGVQLTLLPSRQENPLRGIAANRFAGIFFLTLLFAPRGHCQEENPGFSGDLQLLFDKSTWRDTDEVTGKVLFKLNPPKDWPLAEKPTVLLNQPWVKLRMPTNFLLVPIETRFSNGLGERLRIGQTYELGFRISTTPALKPALKALGATPPLFRSGVHGIGTEFYCSGPGWGHMSDFSARFMGAPQNITITPTQSPTLSRTQILGWLLATNGLPKWDILTFYRDQGLLQPDDLLKVAESADAFLHGKIAKKFGGKEIPLQALTWFTNHTDLALRDDHSHPFFIRLSKGQTFNFSFSGSGTHTLNALTFTKLLWSKSAPGQLKGDVEPGVYEATCGTHHTVWGWILITQ